MYELAPSMVLTPRSPILRINEGSFRSSRMNSASSVDNCFKINRSVSRTVTKEAPLFFAAIDHGLDQLYGDTPAGHQHTHCVSCHIEEQIACHDPFDLIAPFFTATANITEQSIELDNDSFPFARPFVFEGVDRPEVDLNCLNIHTFLMNDLSLCYGLNHLGKDLSHDGCGSHFRWHHQQTFRCKLFQVRDLCFGEGLKAT